MRHAGRLPYPRLTQRLAYTHLTQLQRLVIIEALGGGYVVYFQDDLVILLVDLVLLHDDLLPLVLFPLLLLESLDGLSVLVSIIGGGIHSNNNNNL